MSCPRSCLVTDVERLSLVSVSALRVSDLVLVSRERVSGPSLITTTSTLMAVVQVNLRWPVFPQISSSTSSGSSTINGDEWYRKTIFKNTGRLSG